MKNFGLCITKNEAPLLRETLQHNCRYIDTVFMLDGGTDNTAQVAREFPQVVEYHHEREFIKPGEQVFDGVRQFLLTRILHHANEGDWITLMHGDEMFHHNPRDSITLAKTLSCNLVKWYAAHFFPHVNDRGNWSYLKTLPITERFTYYAHYGKQCWLEDRQFKIMPGMQYDTTHHASVLPTAPVPWVALPAHPVYRHFKIWNLSMDNYTKEYSAKHHRHVARPEGKWGLMHYTPSSFRNFFIRKYPKYPACGKYNGSFGALGSAFEALAHAHLPAITRTLPESYVPQPEQHR